MSNLSRRSLNALRSLDLVPAFFKSELLEPRRLFAAPPAMFTRVVVSEEIALRSAVPADWDGDGHIDLLGTDAESSSFKLLAQQLDHSFIVHSAGQGDPLLAPPQVAADLNGDGFPDLLRARQVTGGGLFISQLNDGTGALGPQRIKNLNFIASPPTAADIDRDGDLDVLIPQAELFQPPNSVGLLFNDGAGNLSDPINVMGVGTDTIYSVATADFDLDGDVDIAVPSWDWPTRRAYLQPLLNDGAGGFSLGAKVWMPVGSGVPHSSVAATDIEDDGDVDLVVSTGFFIAGADVAVLQNDGTGQFPIATNVQGLRAFNWGIHASDLNGDSLTDVVVGDGVRLAWNTGAGHLEAGMTLVGSSAFLQPPIDINTDGRRDIVDFSTGSAVFFGGGYEDVLAPVASRPRHYVSPQAGPPLIAIDFSEPVTAAGSLAPPVLSVVNLSTGMPIDPALMRATPDAGDIYTWRLPRNLPDGNYRATLDAQNTVDVAGNPLADDFTFDFFVFAGDANRDRAIDMDDFAILASRFDRPGTFAQGDFNYDGVTNIGDFAILASKFNTALPIEARVSEVRDSARHVSALRHDPRPAWTPMRSILSPDYETNLDN